MSRWFVSTPVWGDRCAGVFMRSALPALREAVRSFGFGVKIIVHTDRREKIQEESDWLDVETRDVPKRDNWWECLSDAHREVMATAQRGDRVMLLTADMVVSTGIFETCERHFGQRKVLVCCAGMRSVDTGYTPVGVDGRTLLKWAWEHRHPLTAECTWPDGTSGDLTRMYFASDGRVNSRMWLPHPIALVKDGRSLKFGPTVDANLINNFKPDEIHLITSPDEAAAIELSPTEKEFHLFARMADRIENGEINLSRRVHRWLLSQRIAIVGDGRDAGDAAVAGRILR